MPPGLLDGLPPEDQRAISEVFGKPVLLNEYDDHGRAELEFTDREGVIHFIYVDPSFIRAAEIASSSPLDTARAFVDAINHHNVDDIARLMTKDHVFIDSLGGVVRGRDKMKTGWASYFQMVSGYTITVEETFSDGPVVILLGVAQGTYAGETWTTLAAWRAKVRDDRVAEWRVYADNEPIRQLMRKAR